MGLKHIHLLVRADVLRPKISENDLRTWFSELVRKVGMQELIPPVAKFCDDPDNLGCTGMVGITTSHSSIHIWEKESFLQMDLYSCRDFDIDVVLNHIDSCFEVKYADYMLIDRDNFEVVEKGYANDPDKVFE